MVLPGRGFAHGARANRQDQRAGGVGCAQVPACFICCAMTGTDFAHGAPRVTDLSSEAFILRLFRQRNKTGTSRLPRTYLEPT
eukprot:173873-Rhodomonas_salina.3